MEQNKLPRRALLKGALAGLAAIPVVAAVGTAAAQAPARPAGGALPRLDPNSPQAKALGYVHDGKQVDRKANPSFKPDQLCSNCVHWQGKPTDAWAGCNLFPGRSVAGPGWCRVWAKKP